MEDLPLGRIAALVPVFEVKDLPLGQNTDDDDDDDYYYYQGRLDHNGQMGQADPKNLI